MLTLSRWNSFLFSLDVSLKLFSRVSVVVFYASECATRFQRETGLDCRQAGRQAGRSSITALFHDEAALL